jgi:hypothetical protein
LVLETRFCSRHVPCDASQAALIVWKTRRARNLRTDMGHRPTAFTVTLLLSFLGLAGSAGTAGAVLQIPCTAAATGFSNFDDGTSYRIVSCLAVAPITIGRWSDGVLEVHNSTFRAHDGGIVISRGASLSSVFVSITNSSFLLSTAAAVAIDGVTIRDSNIAMNGCTVVATAPANIHFSALSVNQSSLQNASIVSTNTDFNLAGGANVSVFAVAGSDVSANSRLGIDGGTTSVVGSTGASSSTVRISHSNITASVLWIHSVRAAMSGASTALVLDIEGSTLAGCLCR